MIGMESTIREMFTEIQESHATTLTMVASDDAGQPVGMIILVAPHYIDKINKLLERDESFFENIRPCGDNEESAA